MSSGETCGPLPKERRGKEIREEGGEGEKRKRERGESVRYLMTLSHAIGILLEKTREYVVFKNNVMDGLNSPIR